MSSEPIKDKHYTVPKVEFYNCPACGEKVYDREAMQKIESYRAKARSRKQEKHSLKAYSPA